MFISMLLSELIYGSLGKEKGIKREQKGKEQGHTLISLTHTYTHTHPRARQGK